MFAYILQIILKLQMFCPQERQETIFGMRFQKT